MTQDGFTKVQTERGRKGSLKAAEKRMIDRTKTLELITHGR